MHVAVDPAGLLLLDPDQKGREDNGAVRVRQHDGLEPRERPLQLDLGLGAREERVALLEQRHRQPPVVLPRGWGVGRGVEERAGQEGVFRERMGWNGV